MGQPLNILPWDIPHQTDFQKTKQSHGKKNSYNLLLMFLLHTLQGFQFLHKHLQFSI